MTFICREFSEGDPRCDGPDCMWGCFAKAEPETAGQTFPGIAPGAATAIKLTAWATPAEGVTLDALIAELGVHVLEVDRPGNRLKVIEHTEDL